MQNKNKKAVEFVLSPAVLFHSFKICVSPMQVKGGPFRNRYIQHAKVG